MVEIDGWLGFITAYVERHPDVVSMPAYYIHWVRDKERPLGECGGGGANTWYSVANTTRWHESFLLAATEGKLDHT